MSKRVRAVLGFVGVWVLAAPLAAQTPGGAATAPPTAAQLAQAAEKFLTPPSDYVIGAGDSLSVKFWKDEQMSADVIVRPDGKITLPVLNDVQAAGLTPDQLRARVVEASASTVIDPNVQIYIREIKSRKVYITGMISKPAEYPLLGPMNVAQLISVAGGLVDFADSKNISIIRTENGRQVAFRFNYADFMRRRNLQQNIELKPGDVVVVP